MHGVLVTTTAFIALITIGWVKWLLWISFIILLLRLGGEYNKILNEEADTFKEKMQIMVPK